MSQEEKRLKNQTFGPLTPITRDQYREIYANTGIDIDGRSDLARKAYLPRFKPIIHGMVAFAKSLPGFKDLPIEDQTALLKGIVKSNYVMLIYCQNIRKHFVVRGLALMRERG